MEREQMCQLVTRMQKGDPDAALDKEDLKLTIVYNPAEETFRFGSLDFYQANLEKQ